MQIPYYLVLYMQFSRRLIDRRRPVRHRQEEPIDHGLQILRLPPALMRRGHVLRPLLAPVRHTGSVLPAGAAGRASELLPGY